MTRNTNKIGKEESEHVSYNKKIKFIIRVAEEKLRAPATIGVVLVCRSFLSRCCAVSLLLHHPSPTLNSVFASTCLSPLPMLRIPSSPLCTGRGLWRFLLVRGLKPARLPPPVWCRVSPKLQTAECSGIGGAASTSWEFCYKFAARLISP